MKQSPLLWLVLAGLAFFHTGLLADTGTSDGVSRVDPAINAVYEDPDFDAWDRAFERPGREVYDRREEIVALSGVTQGMTVADLGAGTGLFTLLLAEKVGPEGRVYAVDVSEEFVTHVIARARRQGLEQVRGIVNSQTSTELPDTSVDLVFMSDTYHHFEHPEAMLASIQKALRPGGTLVVIDFRRESGVSSEWVMGHVRAGKETVINEVESVDFRLVSDEELLRENFFLRFVKPGERR